MSASDTRQVRPTGGATVRAEDPPDLVGHEVGRSRWFELSPERVAAFAATLDSAAPDDAQSPDRDVQAAVSVDQDPTAASGPHPEAATPVPPFLLISLLGAMSRDALPVVRGSALGVNYGFDSIRLERSVSVGQRVRARFVLRAADATGSGRWRLTHDIAVETEAALPVLTATWITLRLIAGLGDGASAS